MVITNIQQKSYLKIVHTFKFPWPRQIYQQNDNENYDGHMEEHCLESSLSPLKKESYKKHSTE